MKRNAVVGMALGVAVLTGCRTTEDVLRDYERNLCAGDYATASKEVGELSRKNDDSGLLWTLLAGSATHLAGESADSIGYFDHAEDVFADHDQRGTAAETGNTALGLMTNDRALPYDGGGLDRVFTCLYKAIDFMSLGRGDDARVELNRSLTYQQNWLYDRRREIASAEEKLDRDAASYRKGQQVKSAGDTGTKANTVLNDASFVGAIREKCGFDANGDIGRMAESDYMNPYALHVAGVFRWLKGDSDRGELKDAARFARNNVFAHADLDEQRRNGDPRKYVWVYFEDGLCPQRREWRLDLPLVVFPGLGHYVKYAGMALPYLEERPAGARDYAVTAPDGTSVVPQELADVDHLVRKEYEVYMSGALKREIVRTLTKIGVQIALGVAADNTGNGDHQLALEIAQYGAATWAMTTTAADCRSWMSLPKTVRLARVPCDAAGTLTIRCDGFTQALQVPGGGSLVFVSRPAPSAAPSIRIVTP